MVIMAIAPLVAAIEAVVIAQMEVEAVIAQAEAALVTVHQSEALLPRSRRFAGAAQA